MDLFSALRGLAGGGGGLGGGGYGGGGYGMPAGMAVPRHFQETYRCYSMAMSGRSELEHGDKILLPSSALHVLSQMEVQYPMLFRLTNESKGRKMHVGVMEFSADEGRCYAPHWIMENLLIEEGAFVEVRNLQLPRGSFVKLRPQTSDFLRLTNHKAFLEKQLRSFSCLTKGEHICVWHEAMKKKFYIDVLELKPADAVSIIETDLVVDFAAPADYVEPVRQPGSAANSAPNSATPSPFLGGKAGSPIVIDEDELMSSLPSQMANSSIGGGGGSNAAGAGSSSTSAFGGSGQALGSYEGQPNKRARGESANLLAEAAMRRAAAGAAGSGDGSGTPSRFGPKIQPFVGEGRRLGGTPDGAGAGAGSSSPMVDSARSFGTSSGVSPKLGGGAGSPMLAHGGMVLGGGSSPGGIGGSARPGSASGRERTLNKFEAARREKAFQGQGKSLKEGGRP